MKNQLIKEIFKNFWIPLLLSFGWAAFRYWSAQPETEIFSFIVTNFSGALFLISWAMGQVKRLQKHIGDKQEFQLLGAHLSGIVDKMELQTQQLIGYTLGDSKKLSLFVGTSLSDPNVATFSIGNEGTYPVYDVRIDWYEIGNFDPILWNVNREKDPIPSMMPKYVESDVIAIDMTEKPHRRISINILWRNGSSFYEYEIKRDGKTIMFQPNIASHK